MTDKTKNHYSVTGHIAMQGTVTKYYMASSEQEVLKAIAATPLEEGGFASYTTVLLEDGFPDDAYMTCPHCTERFPDTHRVVELA
jgi:hypothetical protein